MNILKRIILRISAISLLVAPMAAMADYKSEIINSCSLYQQGDDTREINACKLYIDGFIDSSLLTEDGVVWPKEVIAQQSVKQSAFLKRAYQTRVLTTSSSIKNEAAHQFCIPKEYDRRKIASQLAKSIDISLLKNKQLREVLFDTLVADFPCN